jgi:hypothetical protein
MADKQIKNLNEATSTTANDLFIVQNASTDETAKVKASNMIPDGGITPVKLAPHVKVGTMAPTANGDFSVTGIGFTPVYIEIRTTYGTWESGNTVNLTWGGADGTNTFAQGFFATEGGDISGRVSSTYIAWKASANQVQTNTLVLKSFDADGFTVTKATHDTNATYSYVVWG